MTFSYPDYLAAKRSVDARARHPRLWNRVCSFCQERAAERDRPVRILEIGGGVGDLACSLLQALPMCRVDYTIIDVEKENLDAAASNVRSQLPDAIITATDEAPSTRELSSQKRIVFQQRDFLSYRTNTEEGETTEGFDLVIGQAVMDILPVQTSLQIASSVLRPDGAGYFPIHVDGLTEFEPTADPVLDERVSRLYHKSMKRSYRISSASTPVDSDGSRCGRDLMVHAASAGLEIEDAASSDWIVHVRTEAGGKRVYVEDEDVFLRYMLWFFEDELRGHPELDAESFDAWLSRRHRQIDAGELILVVHNLDVFVRRREGMHV